MDNNQMDYLNALIKFNIEAYINPGLAEHNGSIELISTKYFNNIEIDIAYSGTCTTCSLSKKDTLSMIYNFI